jgi:hypothetical protein
MRVNAGFHLAREAISRDRAGGFAQRRAIRLSTTVRMMLSRIMRPIGA